MIPMTLGQIAHVTGGTVAPAADPQLVVDGPAYLDSRSPVPRGLFVAIAGARVDGHEHVQDAHAVLGSRSTARPTVIVDDPAVALGRLARHVVRTVAPRITAITGSQGKTTTKDLLAGLLPTAVATEGNRNNELGVPLTCLQLRHGDTELVVEMGARGVGHLAWLADIARPDVAAVLSIGTAHIGEFGSAALLRAAKSELIQSLAATGTAVLNADDPAVITMAELTPARIFTFGRTGDVRFDNVHDDGSGGTRFDLHHDGCSVPVHLQLPGEHQVVNACAAAALALTAGVDLATIADRLDAARPVSRHRLETVVTSDDVVVIDDCYNSNPTSTAASLKVLSRAGKGRPGRIIAVLGEMQELGSLTLEAHQEIGAVARDVGVDVLVAIGAAAPAAAAFGPAAITVNDAEAASRSAGGRPQRRHRPGQGAAQGIARAGRRTARARPRRSEGSRVTHTSGPDDREVWPDVAKGVCILLVVLWHVVTKHYQQIDWQVTVAGLSISGAWGTLGGCSCHCACRCSSPSRGCSPAAAVGRPLPVLMRTRIAKFAYLYLLWLLIHTLVMSQTPHIDTARARSTWEAGGDEPRSARPTSGTCTPWRSTSRSPASPALSPRPWC
ncbi:UDP-N-acetylmuramoyl-tripeptide--D-alanyl-D-alanine ligase [Aeromicrobium sp. UC242_57]|uniref:UDP-N-acetylmuramoyl-tripeptide--D-alanyl-D- alanine ligase n=1 Tax=Aeromicrobium sp. UC242_57 TaxID=3374624 RepID=UPI0037BE05B8